MSSAAQVYDDLDDRQRADRIDDICDSLSEENVPPDALYPVRAYAVWLRDGVSAGGNECDAAALLREFEQLPVRRLTDQTVVMERSPLDDWRARCGKAIASCRVRIGLPRVSLDPTDQFLCDVRAVVAYHWSGLPERRPDESVWARLDAVLFDDEGQERKQPDYEARP